MKAPSKNISRSLRGQHPRPGGPIDDVGSIKQGKSAGVIPGERGTECAPGMVKEGSAYHSAEKLGRMVGG